MTVIDYCIAACLAVFVFMGLRKGLIRELAGLLGLVVAVLFATRWMSDLTGLAGRFIPLPAAALTVISFIVIFLVSYWGTVLGGRVLAGVAKIILLGWLDRLGGAVFGLLKGTIIISLFLYLTALLPLPEAFFSSYDNALLVKPFKMAAPYVFNGIRYVIPGGRSFYQELRESMTKNMTYDFSTLLQDRRIRRFFSAVPEK